MAAGDRATANKRPARQLAPKKTRSRGRPAGAGASVGPEALVAMTVNMLGEVAPSDITRASLARRANVAPALIRYYFKDRDSLLRTAVTGLTRQLLERGEVTREGADLPPAERIGTRVRALLAFKLANRFYHRLMLEEMASSSDEQSRAVFHEIASGSIERYAGYLDDGVADGSLRPVDPAFLYMAIVGMCEFFVHASPLLPDELGQRPIEQLQAEYGDFVCDLLINGLRPR